MPIRTFAEIVARTDINGFDLHPGDLAQLMFSLEQVYNTTFQSVWNNWLDAHPSSNVGITYDAGNAVVLDSGLGHVFFDPSWVQESLYVTLDGYAVKQSASSALIHEFGHALVGLTDLTASVSNPGSNTTYINQFLPQLNHSLVAHYWSHVPLEEAGLLQIGYSYTGGRQVDTAIVLTTDVADKLGTRENPSSTIDTASNDDLKDLLIGNLANNTLVSGGGTDFLYGSEGDDSLVGDEATLAADGSVQSTTSDTLSDLLEGGIGNDSYYVNYQFVVGQASLVRGNEVALAEMLDLIRDEDGLGKIYIGVDFIDLSNVTMRPNTNPNKYGDFTGSPDDSLGFGGKIVGSEIIYGYFDRSGYESSVWFKTDVGVSLPQNQPATIAPSIAQFALIAASGTATQGSFLGMTFATALNQVEGTSLSETLSGTSNRDYIRGFDGSDNLNGFESDDVIDGGDGNDIISGGAGDDDIIGEAGNDTLIGGDGTDVIDGGAGNDILDGGVGGDQLSGGIGSDTYYIDSLEDVLGYESIYDAGIDHVISAITMDSLAGGYDNLTLTGVAALNGTGNTLANVITGNSAANTLTGLEGNDTLDGGLGDDTLLGGAGDDIYVVDSANDIVTELAGEGTDLVTSSVNFTLSANVENLTLLANSLPAGLFTNGTGNAMNNTITGNIGDNILDGGAGIDTMNGGAGNDIYVIDTLSDIVIENANSGSDWIASSVNYTLAATSNVENLSVSGSGAINLTGNAAANSLQGNGAANILSGSGGNDTIGGGLGNDTLVGGTGADTLSGANGSDRFKFAAGDSGQTSTTRDTLTDFAKGAVGTGDLFDFTSVLTRGGSATAATATQAAINQTTGVASFAAGSGTTLADALADITTRFTAATNSAGEFAFFKIAATGNFYFFVSDGTAGVTANDYLAYTNLSTIGTLNLTAGDLTILT
jgi:trimeric autotransporter adhesin